ncbi:TonB-dependent receptor domain-containing protein [Novosphingobium pokkalii]|uniref:TonB-dependent receptor domain-containing protein n=1 Tax=Novosphingobium pokkalii TaxID=1770194 RepID=A0ABV7V274_9SPHN|nr:TonB-dependent receptor [Novosphingobium pokkalii]GHC90141.1 TonB-dependent receptor [Novosphingobium pokkalii]
MRLEGTRLVLSASALSVAVALATPALAQAAPQADSPPAAEPAQPDVKEIVVTGSLIQRPNNTAVSPIVSVSNEAIKASGNVNLQDALNQLPGFTASGNSGTGGQGTGGRASVNLHGLGPNRNLVLLDGKRLPLSDISGTVDTNIIPESIIGGVDVITGGASAVYGSDAMSGVVNFKTLRSFDGVKADVQNTISEKGDAFKFSGSIAFGSSFAQDRGHVIAAFSYTDQDPLNGSKRSFFSDKTPSSYIGTGTFVPNATNAPNAAVVQSVFGSYGVTSTINPLLNLGFNNDGTLFVQTGAVNYKGQTNTGGYAIVNGNVRMPVGQQTDFLNGLKRKTAFVKADYDLTPDLTLYGQFLFVDLNVHTASGGTLTQFGQLTTIPVTNPFIPQDLRTILASRPNPTANFLWNGRYVGLPYKSWDEDYTVQQYMAGLKGNIAPGWTFDLYGSYDQSVHNQTMHNAVVKSRVQTLLSAADGGASICQGGFNPFGDANARSISAACAAYMTKDAVSTERLGQTQFQGQVNGKLFDLGAGPAQIALVASYRKNTYNYRPDSDLQTQNLEAVTASQPATGRISVKELAGQIDIPLVADKPFMRELGIGAAARVSDYSTTGTVTSYEADARWRPTETIMLRGSYQRAVRAPNIGELFSPQQGTQLVIGTPPGSLGDPCDYRSTARSGTNGAQVAALCVAQGVPQAAIGSYTFPTTATGQLVSGNLGLRPERADTFNAGIVFNAPRGGGFFGDFSFSVDYYNISIKNVISTVPGLTVLSKCYNLDGSNSTYSNTNPYCALIQRDSNGQLVNVVTPYLNLGALKTDGVEMQVNWATPARFIGNTGKIYATTTVGWLHAYKVQLLPGGAELDYTNISNGAAGPSSVPPRATPRWKALTTLGYRSDAMGIGLRWRFQSAMKDASAVLTPSNAQVGVAAYNLYDLFGNVKVGKMFELRGGVTNLLNAKLPYVASSQNGTDVALYDPIGRSFYIGARVTF